MTPGLGKDRGLIWARIRQWRSVAPTAVLATSSLYAEEVPKPGWMEVRLRVSVWWFLLALWGPFFLPDVLVSSVSLVWLSRRCTSVSVDYYCQADALRIREWFWWRDDAPLSGKEYNTMADFVKHGACGWVP